VCHRYSVERPFNGRNLEARQHPQCERWRRGPAGVLRCAEWRTNSCSWSDGVPREPRARSETEIIIPMEFNPEGTPVFGVSCPEG
jgi:hypothetical protein